MPVGRISGMPTTERTDLPETQDERSILLTMLDYKSGYEVSTNA